MTEIHTTDSKPFRESTIPLLKQNQVDEMKEEAARLEKTLAAPGHISGMVQDKPAMHRQLQNIKESLEKNMPRSYDSKELDMAKRREAELVSEIKLGMPTMAEMRSHRYIRYMHHLSDQDR